MKYNEYKKLEKSINNQNFNENYKTINIVLRILSYFGHITSIFLAYFMLSKVIESAMTNNIVIVGISSIIILLGLELLKRNIFDRFSISYLKAGVVNSEVLPLLGLSLLVISLSFYASIKGAAEFSSKSDKIEVESKNTIQIYNDSITKVYNNDISRIDNDIKLKDNILTNLQSLSLTQRLSKDQRATISDLSTQKKDLQQQIENKKEELKTKLETHSKNINIEASGKKENNNKSSLMFIIISTFIELTILAGVYFGEYYKFRSYREFRNKIEKDPSYQKWLLYDEMLRTIFTEDVKVNQKLPSGKTIIDMCRVNSVIVLNRDLSDFLKILTSINIIKSSGSAKYFNKTRDISFEILKKHFNIE